MALTVIERPIGHKITTSYQVTITNVGGKASFAQPTSMSNGDVIYIDGFAEDYNGFWIVNKSGSDVRLQFGDSELVDFIVDTNVTVYKTVAHNWSCMHLPIVYKLKSDFYPNNTNDPVVTISPYGFIGQYFAVTHSSLSGPDGLKELDYVSLNDGDLILRVVEVISDTITVLDSDGTGSFINMQRYRNNYHILINIYAGLNSSHTWASLKPYELASTLKFIPDGNNEVSFSVSEILKSYIDINNNTLLATLPNNIDFITQFYITYQEAYDVSEFPYSVQISVHETDETIDKDNFEGYAANSILEFKNRYSGYLSDYVLDTNLTGSKFLTLFNSPTIFSGKYFDISFINNLNTTLKLKKIWIYDQGTITETQDIPSYGPGLYRVEVDKDCNTLIQVPTVTEIPYSSYFFVSNLEGWFNTVDGVTPDSTSPPIWIWSSFSGGVLIMTQSNTLSTAFAILRKSSITLPAQQSFIRIKWRAQYPYNNAGLTLAFSILDNTNSFIQGPTKLSIATGFVQDDIITVSSSFVWSNADAYLIEVASNTIPIDNSDIIYLLSIEIYTESTTYTPTVYTGFNGGTLQILDGSNNPLSEIKNVVVNCDCEKQSIYLTWLNNLGGFDYWDFTDGSDILRNIKETGETKNNIFVNWPKSYGEKSDTIRKQTFRVSNKGILVRAQHVSLEDLQAIEYLKSSIRVEIVNSRSDKRRVIVDNNSWVSYKDIDKLYTISFTLEYTDDIPAQRL